MQVRSLFVDKNGLIWIGTQGGLAVYDGQQVRTVGEQGPLREEYIMNMTQGANGLIVSALDEAYTFDGRTAKPMGMRDKVPATFVWFQDWKGLTWFLRYETWSPFLLNNGEIKPVGEVYPALSGISILQAWGNPGWQKCYLLDQAKRFYVLDTETGRVSVDSTTLSPSDSLDLWAPRTSNIHDVVIERRTPAGLNELITTELFVIHEDELVLAAALESKDGLLHAVSPFAPLAYSGQLNGWESLFFLNDSIYRPVNLPGISNIRSIARDDRKIYVASDNGLCVLYADGLETVEYPACDYAWSVLPGRAGDLFLGCYKSGIHHIGKDGQLIRQYPPPGIPAGSAAGNQVLSNYLDAPDAYCWGSIGGFLQLEKRTGILSITPTRYSVEAMAIDPRTGDIIAGSDKIYWFDPVSSQKIDSLILESEILAGGYINDLAVTDERYLWVAAPGGVVRINLHDRQMVRFQEKEGTLPCRGGVSLEVDRHGNLWCGGTCGLMILPKGGEKFVAVLPRMIDQRVNQLNVLPDDRVVCAAGNNLYLLSGEPNHPVLLYAYNSKNGLRLFEPSENGSSVADGRYVWLPAVTGIQRLDLSRVPPGFPPASIILLRINDRPVSFLSAGYDSLGVDGSSALLDLLVADAGGRDWKFQFQLNGEPPSPWQSSPEILVSGLRHGRNRILVRTAWDPSDPGSFESLSLVVTASLPLAARHQVQRTFGIAFAILVILVGASVAVARRKSREALELNRKLDINQLRAIQSYFSPHFFFNLMANIQGRILNDDKEASNTMIVKLSTLFRRVLDLGKESRGGLAFTKLSEELRIIEDIVFLNNTLLSEPVRFTLDVPDELRSEDPSIPPMLIEPFVENAFKHAFTEKMKDKHVSVSIREEGHDLIIQIRDNGIGIGQAVPSPRTGTSSGMLLARERMEILNKMKIANTLSVRPVTPHGTLVEIRVQKHAS